MKTNEDIQKTGQEIIRKNDHEITVELLNAFNKNWGISNVKVQAKVKAGWVTLEGDLKWDFQREAIGKSVNKLAGVKGVTNNIKIESDAGDKSEKKDIERAFAHNWAAQDNDIHIKVSGNRVTLNGNAKSLYQKEWAGRIAESSPGVTMVDNELAIKNII